MKYVPLYVAFLITCFLSVSAQDGATKNEYKVKWNVNPFDHKVFIENKGQFDTSVDGKDKVLFAVQQGPMFAYFTPHGIIYKYIEYPKREEASGKDDDDKDAKDSHFVDPDLLPPVKPIAHYLYATWQGSSPAVMVSGGEEQQDYYAYPKGKKSGIKVNIFKKITYLNLYPNIDVEYIFPNGKEGIKYTIIVHPGGDASLAKLKYDGAQNMQVQTDGSVQITTGWGSFTDFAPHSYYKESGDPVASNYALNDSTESFIVNNIKASQTLMIDPYTVNWTTTTLFTSASSYDGAYDLDYDNLGNVWVYGSWTPLQLVKYNSAGVKQWTYNDVAYNTGYYGDFAVDKFDGNAYTTEGFNGAGAISEKISPAGVLLGTSPSVSSLEEMWRITFDPCHRVFPVGGGGFSPVQVCMLDTSMGAPVPVNALAATAGEVTHDVTLITTDPNGANAYMAVAQSAGLDPNNFINVFFQMPIPALAPSTYILGDGFNFQESAVPTYVGPGGSTANGMNGMAASPNWLYMYDGQTLKQANKNTGAITLTNTIGTSAHAWRA